jgi:hypothetical protein
MVYHFCKPILYSRTLDGIDYVVSNWPQICCRRGWILPLCIDHNLRLNFTIPRKILYWRFLWSQSQDRFHFMPMAFLRICVGIPSRVVLKLTCIITRITRTVLWKRTKWGYYHLIKPVQSMFHSRHHQWLLEELMTSVYAHCIRLVFLRYMSTQLQKVLFSKRAIHEPLH